MDDSLFYCDIEETALNRRIIEMFKAYSARESKQVYIINSPLGSSESISDYEKVVVVLHPKRKICVINLSSDSTDTEKFEEFCDDFVEDLGYLSDKYNYKIELGRPRVWREKLIVRTNIEEIDSIEAYSFFTKLNDNIEQRNVDFLVSLLIGSINDISRIGGGYPDTLLDQVKRKIVLFDGDQSRFIYTDHVTKKRITIQGLAGTGKTELLLHKLKDLYVRDKNSKIVFTCYNKVLAKSMKKRIPEFFDFMKVEEQIKWDDRLWVMSSWGSRGIANSGLYSYICSEYNLPFHSYSSFWQFDKVCQEAMKKIRELENIEPCFDYLLVDESQDFPQSFFELCELVTRNTVYVAGDIFQDIYDRAIKDVKSDYLLNKCYRTDPKTLMFAHAVGMGLYEKPVLRWLTDEEWKTCGYMVKRGDDKCILSRAPLRRFEDLNDVNSINIISIDDNDIIQEVISVVELIKTEHPTVNAGDIAIVFEGNANSSYEMADQIAIAIRKKYSWDVVKGYETKDSTNDAVYLSNRNNIKGLEFPFVICIVRSKIQNNIYTRNALYMMLTRSFISSYFVVEASNNKEFISIYTNAANEICCNGNMILRQPSDSEIEMQNNAITIKPNVKVLTIKEIIDDSFNEYPDLSLSNRKRIKRMILEYIEEEGEMSEAEIREKIDKVISAFV